MILKPQLIYTKMIKNCIKTSNFISVILDSGTNLMCTTNIDDIYFKVLKAQNDDEIISLMCPEMADQDETENVASKGLHDLRDGAESAYLELRGDSIYIPSVSELTVPQDFAEALRDAELNNDQNLIETYLNFWTLVSLNPDSRVRNNLFWFIRRWNVKITHSGLLVVYRNADFKHGGKYGQCVVSKVTSDYIKVKSQKQSPRNFVYDTLDDIPSEDSMLINTKKHPEFVGLGHTTLFDWYEKVTAKEDTTTYTDHHSHTFTIKIGTPVSMPREDTDHVQEHDCSRGSIKSIKIFVNKEIDKMKCVALSVGDN